MNRDATGRRVLSGGALVLGCPSVTDEGQAVSEDRRGRVAPLLPDWDGACLHHVVPTLAAQLRDPGRAPLPSWFPDEVVGARQVVLLVLDGLGAEQLRERSALAPVLGGGAGGTITTVVPSTTACALTSLATGRAPADHGVVGYRVAVDGEVMNVLQWSRRGVDVRVEVPARTFQPCPPFPGIPAPVSVVTRYDYGPTGFTAAHLGAAALHRWQTAAGLVTAVRELAAAGTPFVYAYYEGVDRVAHAEGLGAHYDDELRAVDRLVGDVLDVLPQDAVLVVTADHGQVDVGGSVEVLGPELMDAVTLLSGEGRFRWLHVRPGATNAVAETARARYEDVAWVLSKEQVIEEGWLGGVPSAAVAARLGDVVLVPYAPMAFLDPADTGELRLKARHGSLTRAEMLVPLLAWRAG